MFVNKGKINTTRFFSYAAMHHKGSPEKPQYNMATHPFDPPPPQFSDPPPPFPSILKTPSLLFMKGVRTMP